MRRELAFAFRQVLETVQCDVDVAALERVRNRVPVALDELGCAAELLAEVVREFDLEADVALAGFLVDERCAAGLVAAPAQRGVGSRDGCCQEQESEGEKMRPTVGHFQFRSAPRAPRGDVRGWSNRTRTAVQRQ